MRNKNYSVFVSSPFTWIQLLGTTASIITFLQGYHEIGFIILGVLLVALSFTCIHYVKNTHKYKQKTKAFHNSCLKLHDLTHETRDLLTTNDLLKIYKSNDSEIWSQIIKNILTKLESCFEILSGKKCTASIMLPDNEINPKQIKTTIYSTSEGSKRREKKTSLIVGQGLAGKAFQTGKSHFSNNFEENLQDFFPVRKNFQEFYKSGISTPFKVNNKTYGIVNLDWKETKVVEEDLIILVECIADFIGFIVQLSRYKPKTIKIKDYE